MQGEFPAVGGAQGRRRASPSSFATVRGASPAAAAGPQLSEVTAVGVRNGYSESAHTYLAQG